MIRLRPGFGGQVRRSVGGLALAALLAWPAAAQQPTFRSSVELIQVDAVVTDADGNPVRGLTAADFELFEEGKRRDIAAFATVDIPIERAERPLFAGAPIEPDIASNSGPEGRVYMVLFDDMDPVLALRTRRFLRTFFERHMGANDVAAIAYLSKGAANSQDFTGNTRLLLTQLDKFSGGFGDQSASALQDRMGTFRDVMEFLAAIQGRRKAVLMVSTGTTGLDAFDIIDYHGGNGTIASEYAREAMVAASRGNVVLYPIDPRGLDNNYFTGADTGDAPTLEAANARNQLDQGAGMNLRSIADLTGGFALTGSNRFEAAFTRLVRENSSYYILGFQTGDDRRNGRFRRLDVRVTRPGLQVRTRSGYVAPTSRSRTLALPKERSLGDAVNSALSSALARPAVAMRLFASPYKGTDTNAVVPVVVQVDPAALDLVEKDGTFSGQLEIAVQPTNGRKQLKGVFHVLDVALKRETFERGTRDGVRIVTSLELPPGSYQLRAAAGNRVSRAGSVIADLEIPDFSKAPLVLSGVAIRSDDMPPGLTIVADDALGPLPAPPTTSREFAADDTLTVFAEVYDNLRTAAAHSVGVRAALIADSGTEVRSASEAFSSADLKGKSGGFGFHAELPLSGAAPGLYVVRVEARAGVGDRPAVRRDVVIRIR